MQLILDTYCYMENNGFNFKVSHNWGVLVASAHLAVLRTRKQQTLRAKEKHPESAWFSWDAAVLGNNWEQIINFWMEHVSIYCL
jgi:hypothetical protein